MLDRVLEALHEAGIAGPLQEAWYYVDEPQYFQYWLNVLVDGEEQRIAGTAFTSLAAREKAVYEAVERHFLGATPTPLRESTLSDINLAFPVSDMPRVPSGPLDPAANFPTVLVQSIPDSGPPVQAPAQLVFVPYRFSSREPVLRQPISTGTACGTGLDDATLRGMLECIERHELLTSYELQVAANRVDLAGQSPHLDEVVDELRRCRLELILVDIGSSWLPTYTFLALVIDRTGIGPGLTAGCKTGLAPLVTAYGAIEEAMHTRTWLRDMLNTTTRAELTEILEPGFKPRTFRDRGLLWSQRDMLKHLKFYLDAPTRGLADYEDWTADVHMELAQVLQALTSRNLRAFRYDLSTGSPLERLGIKVIRVLVPGLQPLFIDERLAVSVGSRPASPPHFFL